MSYGPFVYDYSEIPASVSDLTHTPTRQMAQSAAQSANAAYALARQAIEKIDASGMLMDTLAVIQEGNRVLTARVLVLERTERGNTASILAMEARLQALEKPATVRATPRKAKA